MRCAIYTRKSSEEGLEQAFNSLDAQREACAAFILSQKHEGWTVLPTLYDDGGFSGGTMDRPALKRLLGDIRAGKVDVVVVYKIDRLTRSLFDFAKIVEAFDARGVSFVSVTQQFNTTTSHGAADPERPALLCPVRAGGDRRTNPRQDRRFQEEGHVDGRPAVARLRRAEPEAGRQRGGGSHRPSISSGATSSSDRCALYRPNSMPRGSGASGGFWRTAPSMAARSSPAAPFI